MPESYPRVLMVNGAAFGEQTSMAVTLTNLFQGWPSDRIALAHGDSGAPDPGFGICRRLWPLSTAHVPIDRTVRKLLAPWKEVLFLPSAGGPSEAGTSGKAASLRIALHGIARACADMLPCHPPRAFWRWIDDFQPQVIYSLLASIRLMDLVLRVARHCRAPVVPHFMDDWPTTLYRGAGQSIPRALMLSKLRSIVRRSPQGMTIGPAMAEEYERRFGIPFEGFMNCVETPAVCPAPPSLEGGRPLRLAFVGGLHLNRWRAMEDIGKALLVLREEGRATELIVYISTADRASYGEALSAIPTIRLCPSLSSDELMPTLQAADILVHLDSFDPGPRQFLRLSMSTKLPTYMSCGRPILAYGPREVGSCRYIETCGCGVVVGERDVGALVTALRPLAGNPQERARLGARGWQVASEQHRGDKVRQRFRSVLARATSGSQTVAGSARV